ncbi:hypothetical protein KAR91_12320 [Candidatus Pacearchaeota archaeon]|nr:hypothetical protein [Candidatus Pacearchaeota archaeon]
MKETIKKIKKQVVKKLSLITKFRHFWSKLSESEQGDLWNILTALRGPDKGNSAAKYVTASRIRGELLGKRFICLKSIHGAYAFCSKEDAVAFCSLSEEIETGDDVRRECGAHFANHFTRAVEALKKHVPEKRTEDINKLKW